LGCYKERTETGSELWRRCGSSTIIPINSFGNFSVKSPVSSQREAAEKQHLQAHSFLYGLGIVF
jgi:hypothetical protein